MEEEVIFRKIVIFSNSLQQLSPTGSSIKDFVDYISAYLPQLRFYSPGTYLNSEPYLAYSSELISLISTQLLQDYSQNNPINEKLFSPEISLDATELISSFLDTFLKSNDKNSIKFTPKHTPFLQLIELFMSISVQKKLIKAQEMSAGLFIAISIYWELLISKSPKEATKVLNLLSNDILGAKNSSAINVLKVIYQKLEKLDRNSPINEKEDVEKLINVSQELLEDIFIQITQKSSSSFNANNVISFLLIYIENSATSPERSFEILKSKYPYLLELIQNSLLIEIHCKKSAHLLKFISHKASINFPEIADFFNIFFEIFEALDEKQVHIIEPYLLKIPHLINFKSSFMEEKSKVLSWIFILINKMCGHDNRNICFEGIKIFFNLQPADFCTVTNFNFKSYADVIKGIEKQQSMTLQNCLYQNEDMVDGELAAGFFCNKKLGSHGSAQIEYSGKVLEKSSFLIQNGEALHYGMLNGTSEHGLTSSANFSLKNDLACQTQNGPTFQNGPKAQNSALVPNSALAQNGPTFQNGEKAQNSALVPNGPKAQNGPTFLKKTQNTVYISEIQWNFLSMFLNSILPKIQETIGWICPNGKIFTEFAHCLSRFISSLSPSAPDSLLLLLGFITENKKQMSPLSAYFIVKGLYYGVKNIKDVENEEMVRVVGIMNKFLQKTSPVFDEFIKGLVTEHLLAIYLLMTSKFPTIHISDNEMSKNTIEFLALLPQNLILLNHEKFDFKLEKISLNLSPLFKIGLARTLVFSSLQISENSDFFIDLNPEKIEIFQEVMDLSYKLSNYFGKKCTFLVSFHKLAKKELVQILLKFFNLYLSGDKKNFWDDLALGKIKNFEILKIDEDELENFGNDLEKDLEILNIFEIYLKAKEIFISSDEYVEFIQKNFKIDYFYKVMKEGRLKNYKNVANKEIFGNFYRAKCRIFGKMIEWIGKDDFKFCSQILFEVLEEMDIVGAENVIKLLEVLCLTLDFFNNLGKKGQCIKDDILNFVPLAWSLVLELRKTDVFWPAVTAFSSFITHDFFTNTPVLSTYASKIFTKSETMPGISSLFLSQLHKIDLYNCDEERVTEISKIATRATYFGNTLMKHNRLVMSIYYHENETQSRGCSMTPSKTIDRSASLRYENLSNGKNFMMASDSKTRLLGLLTLSKIQNSYNLSPEWREANLNLIVNELLDLNDKISMENPHHFKNSLSHRLKQRIGQALLTLQGFYSQKLAKEVSDRLMRTLAHDSTQQSVRYLNEFTIILNLIKFPKTHTKFFESCIENTRTRSGFASFASTIFLHVALNLETEGEKERQIYLDFTNNSFDLLTNFMLGQHLVARIYAQVVYEKLFEKYLSVLGPKSKSVSKYEVLYQTLIRGSYTNTGVVTKVVETITDFWITDFNPLSDNNLETIFIEIPKLCGMTFDELILKSDLAHLSQGAFPHQSVSLRRKYERLNKEHQEKILSSKSDREIGELYDVDEFSGPKNNSNSCLNPKISTLQRKLNPWRFYAPVEEEVESYKLSKIKREKNDTEGLIVVGSLLDKNTNLGGLCRTAEIFGAQFLAVPSLKILNEQEFKNLSVSSQNWIQILEVMPRDLERFLKSYSGKGYKIVAVEQAIGSIPLNEFKFQQKTVLLLGHEKYGIPPHLLDVVDVCLEIPQVGLVRSLNVHVTGALCIWEYFSQHS